MHEIKKDVDKRRYHKLDWKRDTIIDFCHPCVILPHVSDVQEVHLLNYQSIRVLTVKQSFEILRTN